MLPTAPPDLACRCTVIITWLCATIAVRAAKDSATRPLLVQLWGALRRRARRLETLIARFRAGTLRPPRPACGARTTRPGHPPAAPPLPGGFAWLVRAAPETAVYGSQLQALLRDPEMTALLSAAPQAGRLLRPLCRMLGLRPGPTLAPALVLPRRERPPRPARPKPARPPDLRPRPARPWRLGSFHLGPRDDATTGPPPEPAAAPPPARAAPRR